MTYDQVAYDTIDLHTGTVTTHYKTVPEITQTLNPVASSQYDVVGLAAMLDNLSPPRKQPNYAWSTSYV